MKKVTSLLLAATLLSSQIAQAECDFSTGIEKMPDGRFAYTSECHKKVGKMVLDLKDREDQVAALNKTIELKDLMIVTNEKRADLWMNTSLKLEDKVNTIDQYRETNKWLWFGVGVLFTGLSVWGAGQLRK